MLRLQVCMFVYGWCILVLYSAMMPGQLMLGGGGGGGQLGLLQQAAAAQQQQQLGLLGGLGIPRLR